jgi:hypothetical protein
MGAGASGRSHIFCPERLSPVLASLLPSFTPENYSLDLLQVQGTYALFYIFLLTLPVNFNDDTNSKSGTLQP